MSIARPRNTGLVDLAAIRACDGTFDALAARRSVPSDDPAVGLLAALVADVDTDLPAPRSLQIQSAADGGPSGPIPVGPEPSARRKGRRIGLRTAITSGVAAAVLATTGVAAGAIGYLDPVERALGIEERSAASVDEVRDALDEARHQIDHGEYDAARGTLRHAWRRWATVRGPEAAELATAIESLQHLLAQKAGAPPEPDTVGGSTEGGGASLPALPVDPSGAGSGSSAGDGGAVDDPAGKAGIGGRQVDTSTKVGRKDKESKAGSSQENSTSREKPTPTSQEAPEEDDTNSTPEPTSDPDVDESGGPEGTYSPYSGTPGPPPTTSDDAEEAAEEDAENSGETPTDGEGDDHDQR